MAYKVLNFDNYFAINEKVDKTIAESFESEVGADILMKEMIAKSGELMEYTISRIENGPDKDTVVVTIEVYAVVASSVSIVYFFSKEKAQALISFLKKTRPVDLYLPANRPHPIFYHIRQSTFYSEEEYYTIEKSTCPKIVNIHTLCLMLQNLNVNLEEILHKNRGKLHGKKFGL